MISSRKEKRRRLQDKEYGQSRSRNLLEEGGRGEGNRAKRKRVHACDDSEKWGREKNSNTSLLLSGEGREIVYGKKRDASSILHHLF